MVEQSVQLPDGPEAVRIARRFTAHRLADTPAETLVADAESVVAELTSNAVMHGNPPVTVTVELVTDGVRIEVCDASLLPPAPAVPSQGAMTGRGLSLVEALARRWGVSRRDGGKAVWAFLSLHPDASDTRGPSGLAESDLLASWPDLAETVSGETRLTVRLGDVPTDLLLEAKAHVDNLVREFTLATSGAASGRTAPVPTALARLIGTVTTRFAEARQSIKQQALAAAEAGQERTTLVLSLPATAAEAGLDYLSALDEADSFARAARLLTLETPPAHRAFRRWYVTSLVDQLRARARGLTPASPPSFERHLLDELSAVTAARRAADRSARLQVVTAALARATTPEEVAAVVVSEGTGALGASGGGLLVPVDDGYFAVPGTVGYDEVLVEQLRAARTDARLPVAHVLRTGEAVWIESAEERDAQFPDLFGLEPSVASLCAVPLMAAGKVLGVLRLSFAAPRLFDDDERRFILALAAQTAHALQRSTWEMAERRARDAAETAVLRLTRLHHVTAALAAATDISSVTDLIIGEAHATLGATVSALTLLEDDNSTLRVVGLQGARPETRERWPTFPVAADLPASEAVRTNRPVVARTRTEIESRFPGLAGQVPEERSLVSLPMSAGERTLGALTLTFPPTHALDGAEMELLTTISQQCAQALERARLLAGEREAHRHSAFMAEATGRLTSSLEVSEALRRLTDLLVPELADRATVHLLDETGRPQLVAATHRDPTITEGVTRFPETKPPDLGEPDGLRDVLRTGRSILLGAGQASGGEGAPEETVNGLRDTAPPTGLGVPIIGREGIRGALLLARDSGPYTGKERQLVADIADRAATAVDNAEQFRRERDAAVTLQRSLLPRQVPRLPGVSFAWRYLPGSAGTYIGGDWYDVVPLAEDRLALVIGDVMGRGLRAAAVMGQLRATARAHAFADLGPTEVLERLDSSLSGLEQDNITTALVALLNPADGSMTIASAGHLPPLLTNADGPAAYLDVEPGPPLGTANPHYRPLVTTLPAGSTLLLFTDGLVEDRRLSLDHGMRTLATAVGTVTGPEAVCDRALAALGRANGHEDDIAMLAVSLHPD